jgi:hypothetical protein
MSITQPSVRNKAQNCHSFFERSITQKVCTARSRENNKIVPLTNLNKYQYNGESEIKVNTNNNSESLKKTW